MLYTGIERLNTGIERFNKGIERLNIEISWKRLKRSQESVSDLHNTKTFLNSAFHIYVLA